MTAALRSLLTGILDYAGLFPPASLSLDDCVRNHASYLKSPDRWMLGRMICPTARLHELGRYLGELFSDHGEPLHVSVLGRGGKDSFDFVANLEADLIAIRAARDVAGNRATFDVFETRVFADAAENDQFLAHLAGVLKSLHIKAFVEVPWSKDAPRAATAHARAITAQGLGYKLRTGGTDAAAFPSAEILAHSIVACRDAKCPIKFTAGLHHPIRAFHKSVNATMHGFINVFAAGVLAHTHRMDEHGVAEILNTEAAEDFSFDEYGLRWKTLNATRQRIEQARSDGLISFGSCSFDEPREDLRSLGWM